MKCPKCDKEILDDSIWCEHCGEKVSHNDKENKKISQNSEENKKDSDNSEEASSKTDTENENGKENENNPEEVVFIYNSSDSNDSTTNSTTSSTTSATTSATTNSITNSTTSLSQSDNVAAKTDTQETYRKIIIACSVVIIAVVVVVCCAFGTARHWTKVDKAAYDEPSYQVPSGSYDVTMSRTDNCSVGESWTNCINKKVDQYNANCANRSLTWTGSQVCASYEKEINRMKSLNRAGYYVTSLGNYGNLSCSQAYTTVKGKHHDAETHEAVCYLGFIGECQ